MTEQQASGHTVLAEADGHAYQSLRQRPVTRAERYALGKSLRKRVPRRTLADWEPPSGRPDPIQQITVSHQGRADRLIPVRVGRMIASPYGFLRGTAVVMAEDVAHLPSTGITPVLAKGHARTSGASMVSGYMGRSDRVDTALCTFARRYADQTEADHTALIAAVDRGMLPVERGV